ncbi:unnamed protein product [Caretta caretta]
MLSPVAQTRLCVWVERLLSRTVKALFLLRSEALVQESDSPACSGGAGGWKLGASSSLGLPPQHEEIPSGWIIYVRKTLCTHRHISPTHCWVENAWQDGPVLKVTRLESHHHGMCSVKHYLGSAVTRTSKQEWMLIKKTGWRV